MTAPRIRRVDLLILAALSYIPFLLSSPGKVSGDTKQYRYGSRSPQPVLRMCLPTWN